jgi:hypothetical protein
VTATRHASFYPRHAIRLTVVICRELDKDRSVAARLSSCRHLSSCWPNAGDAACTRKTSTSDGAAVTGKEAATTHPAPPGHTLETSVNHRVWNLSGDVARPSGKPLAWMVKNLPQAGQGVETPQRRKPQGRNNFQKSLWSR